MGTTQATGLSRRERTELERTAYHEAGHAAVGLALGLRVEYVEVTRDGGLVKFDSWHNFEPQRNLVMTVAGEVAERLSVRWQNGGKFHKGTPAPVSQGRLMVCLSDREEADASLAWKAAVVLIVRRAARVPGFFPPVAVPSREEVQRVLRSAELDADRILRGNWEWVCGLVGLLYPRGPSWVSGEEVLRRLGPPVLPFYLREKYGGTVTV
jgi:hypothetical protein